MPYTEIIASVWEFPHSLVKGVSVLQISVKLLGIYLQQLSGLSFQVIEFALFCYAAVSKLLSIGTTYTRLEDAVNRSSFSI